MNDIAGTVVRLKMIRKAILCIVIFAIVVFTACNFEVNTASDYLLEADKKMAQKDYYGAALDYQRAMEMEPDLDIHIKLAEAYFLSGNRAEASNVIENVIVKYEDVNDDFYTKLTKDWLKMILSAPKGESQKLSEEELLFLSHLAYITSPIRNFTFSKELDKYEYLIALKIYYNNETIIPARAYSSSVSGYDLPQILSDDFVFEDYYVVSDTKADYFAQNVFGTDFPREEFDYDIFGESIYRENGNYYIAVGDFATEIYSVSKYAYLGNDMFLVVFDLDNRSLPGGDQEWEIEYDSAWYLFERSDGIWRFNVKSKFKKVDYLTYFNDVLGLDAQIEMTTVDRILYIE